MSEELKTQQETTETISEVTPAQETTDTTAKATEATPPANTEETWEYDGNRQKVPKPFERYAKGFDRYVSRKDQAIAEANKKIQEYESKLKEFQTSKPTATRQEEQPQAFVTQDEIDAIALGDAKTLEAVIERKAKALLEANVSPMKNEMKTLAMERQEREAAATISAFSDMHPDFQELLKSPVGEYMVNAAKQGMDLETIHKNASAIRDHFYNSAEEKRKADIEKKKNGSVVGKSIPGTSEVVYVDNADQQRRMALELEIKGDKRQVHIRPKKR